MPLFAADAALLAARIALAEGRREIACADRDEADALIAQYGYGRALPNLAVLDAELDPNPTTFAAAKAAVAEGWWSLIPRLEALGADVSDLRNLEDAYNAERDAYLRTTLSPRNDPIADYLAEPTPPPAAKPPAATAKPPPTPPKPPPSRKRSLWSRLLGIKSR